MTFLLKFYFKNGLKYLAKTSAFQKRCKGSLSVWNKQGILKNN
jgi:hypothetical protein